MMRYPRKSGSLAVLLLLIAGAASGLLWLQAAYLPGAPPQLGQPLPSLTFTDGGKNQIGFGRFLGRKLLAVFVDPECGFCQAQYQVLREFHQEASAYSLAVVVVVRQEPGAADQADSTLPFPVWIDAHGQLRRKLGTSRVPALFLLDEDGILRTRQVGYQALDDIVAFVRHLDRPQSVLASNETVTP